MLVTWTAILAVALIELGMAVTPGPNMIYLASRSISQGTCQLQKVIAQFSGAVCTPFARKVSASHHCWALRGIASVPDR